MSVGRYNIHLAFCDDGLGAARLVDVLRRRRYLRAGVIQYTSVCPVVLRAVCRIWLLSAQRLA